MLGSGESCEGPLIGFVLAAGEGRRLRPLTFDLPKAAVPFLGVPLVELSAINLADAGVSRIVVNTCHLAEEVECVLARGFQGRIARQPGPRPAESAGSLAGAVPPVVISRESHLLNTGGGLRQGLNLIPEAATVLVHNADVVSNFRLRELLRSHRERRSLATIMLVPQRGPQTVEVGESGLIESFRQPPGSAPYTFSGIYVFRRRLLDFLPDSEAPSIVEAMERALAAGETVIGHVASDCIFWSDLGTLHDYIEAHSTAASLDWGCQPWIQKALEVQRSRRESLARKGVTMTGAIGLGDRIEIDVGVRLHDCILWEGVKVRQPPVLSFGVITRSPSSEFWRTHPEGPDERLIRMLDCSPDSVARAPLVEQGSGRVYYRLRVPEGRTWVWVSYTFDRPENANFATCARFLERCGVRGPRVQAHLPDVCEVLMEDLGDIRLLDVEPGRDRLALLRQVVIAAARLHTVGASEFLRTPIPLEPPFDEELYEWERDYFREMTLVGVYGSGELWTESVDRECLVGQDLLLRSQQVPVHRDLQSANVMVKEGEACLIDFQGMRMGVGAYDLAALIYDPYARLPRYIRDELYAGYCDSVSGFGGMPPSGDLLAAAAVQRLLQALGAYGKLWRHDGRIWYAQFIESGLDMLVSATRKSPAFAAVNGMAAALLDRTGKRSAPG